MKLGLPIQFVLSLLLFHIVCTQTRAIPLMPVSDDLLQVIRDISQRYNVHFTYDREIVEDVEIEKYTPEAYVSVDDALRSVLAGTNLKYVMLEMKYVIIYQDDAEGMQSLEQMVEVLEKILEQKSVKRKVDRLDRLASSTNLSRIQLEKHRMVINVTGVVTDQVGEPLIGVNVLVQGTNMGTATDIDGKFELEDVNENAILIFSYVGYETMEYALNGRSNISITMVEDLQTLDEVVVVGYGTMKKSDITGAVSSISSEEFEDEAIANVSQGLQGKVAGVNVTTGSGKPGGDLIVRIRGNTSVLGSNDPLYVIDGVPRIGNTDLLSTMNPSDIASIEILKDASATAIYGSRGSNGVILITTKIGKEGKNLTEFETSVGYREIENKLELMNSRQFAEIANERNINDGLPPIFTDINSLSAINTDWQDEIYRRGIIQNHTLRFSGGTEKTKYLVAGNYFDEEGIILGSDFLRGSLRLNLDQKVSNKLSISARLLASRSKYNEVNDGLIILSALAAPPFLKVRNEDGSYVDAATLKQFPFSPSSGDNPVAVARERLNTRTVDRFLGTVTAKYSITDNIILNVSLGSDILSSKRDVYNPRILESGLPAGSGSKSFNSTSSFLNENTINFNKTIGGIHSLEIVGGFTWQTEQWESLAGSSSGFVNDELQNNVLDFGENYAAPSTDFNEWYLLSWLGRANYAINDKYLFTLSGRTDGSSRFGEGNKWGFFPSGAFAWRISEESFIKDRLNHLSNLKVRISYGVSGNQAISPYQSLQRFTGVGLAFGGTPTSGFVAENQGNAGLKWETTNEFNTGLEIGFWNQRLRMNLDYYVKNTNDLLARVNLPPSSGFRTTIQNIGSTRNSGVELQVGTTLISNHRFEWDLNLNAYRNVNEVTKTAGGQDIIAPTVDILGSANIVREGEPLSAFFGLKTNGLTEDGLINYVDVNNDGQVNDADRVVIGSPYPDYFYGLTSNVSYGDFSLAVSVVGEAGKTLWNHNRQLFMSSFHRGYNQLLAVATERWTPQNPNGQFPRATNALNQSPSEYYLEDASYLRIQNITLNYRVPTTTLNITSISYLNIYLGIQNLITFTDYSWYTPDVNSFASGDLRIGIDQRTYPSSRTFKVGLKLGF